MAKHEDMIFENLPKKSKKTTKQFNKPISKLESSTETQEILKYVFIAILILLIIALAFKIYDYKSTKDAALAKEVVTPVKKLRENLPPPPAPEDITPIDVIRENLPPSPSSEEVTSIEELRRILPP